MSVSSRQPGIPFTLEVSAPNPTVDIDVVQAGAPGINEIQQLSFAPAPTQGYFAITWDLGSGNETSNNINVPLTAEIVKAAMVAGMASITDDNLLVTGSGTPEDPFQFELQDDLAETSVALMTVNVANLLGVGGNVNIGTIQHGSDGSGTGALFQNDAFTEATTTLITSHTSNSAHSWSVTGPEPSVFDLGAFESTGVRGQQPGHYGRDHSASFGKHAHGFRRIGGVE